MSSECQPDNISLSRVTYCPRDHHTGGNAWTYNVTCTSHTQPVMVAMQFHVMGVSHRTTSGEFGPLREPFTLIRLHLNSSNTCCQCMRYNRGAVAEQTVHGQSPQGDAAEQGAVAEQEPLLIPAYHVHQCTVNPNSSTKGNSLSPTEI
ncbi:hypothetical protein BDR07DRAFT_1377634 [Suillus spraguei]|nr:hypothetical protein BDR07DRAFT_1377634 [Suillus spraguei]